MKKEDKVRTRCMVSPSGKQAACMRVIQASIIASFATESQPRFKVGKWQIKIFYEKFMFVEQAPCLIIIIRVNYSSSCSNNCTATILVTTVMRKVT